MSANASEQRARTDVMDPHSQARDSCSLAAEASPDQVLSSDGCQAGVGVGVGVGLPAL